MFQRFGSFRAKKREPIVVDAPMRQPMEIDVPLRQPIGVKESLKGPIEIEAPLNIPVNALICRPIAFEELLNKPEEVDATPCQQIEKVSLKRPVEIDGSLRQEIGAENLLKRPVKSNGSRFQPLKDDKSLNSLIKVDMSLRQPIEVEQSVNKPKEFDKSLNRPIEDQPICQPISDSSHQPIAMPQIASFKRKPMDVPVNPTIGVDKSLNRPIEDKLICQPISDLSHQPITMPQITSFKYEPMNVPLSPPIRADKSMNRPMEDKPICQPISDSQPITVWQRIGSFRAKRKPKDLPPIKIDESLNTTVEVDAPPLRQPIKFEKSPNTPIEADPSVCQPIEVKESLNRPIEVDASQHQLIQVENSLQRPVNIDGAQYQPIKDEKSLNIPIGIDASLCQPIGVKESLNRPIEVDASKHQTIQVENSLKTSVEIDGSQCQSIKDEKSLSIPKGIDASLFQPIEVAQSLNKSLIRPIEEKSLIKLVEDKSLNIPIGIDASLFQPIKVDQSLNTSIEFDKSLVRPIEDKSLIRPIEDKSLIRPIEDKSLIRPIEDKSLIRPIEDKCLIRLKEDKSLNIPIEDKPICQAIKNTSHQPIGEELSPPITVWQRIGSFRAKRKTKDFSPIKIDTSLNTPTEADALICEPIRVKESLKGPIEIEEPLNISIAVDALLCQPTKFEDSLNKPVHVDVSIREPMKLEESLNKPTDVDASLRQPIAVEESLEIENQPISDTSRQPMSILQRIGSFRAKRKPNLPPIRIDQSLNTSIEADASLCQPMSDSCQPITVQRNGSISKSMDEELSPPMKDSSASVLGSETALGNKRSYQPITRVNSFNKECEPIKGANLPIRDSSPSIQPIRRTSADRQPMGEEQSPPITVWQRIGSFRAKRKPNLPPIKIDQSLNRPIEANASLCQPISSSDQPITMKRSDSLNESIDEELSPQMKDSSSRQPIRRTSADHEPIGEVFSPPINDPRQLTLSEKCDPKDAPRSPPHVDFSPYQPIIHVGSFNAKRKPIGEEISPPITDSHRPITRSPMFDSSLRQPITLNEKCETIGEELNPPITDSHRPITRSPMFDSSPRQPITLSAKCEPIGEELSPPITDPRRPIPALRRWHSLRIGRARPQIKQQVSLEAPVETDTAYDAKDYFADDVVDPWSQQESLDRTRQSQHAQLRALVQRGESNLLRQKLAALGEDAGIVANLTPGGANTLLYVAAEAGLTSAVSALLSAGADGRAHPVTRYGPLYAAAYHGHAELAKLLLAHFPQAAQQATVEKWLPLHAACIGGHAALVSLLLDYPYPDEVRQTYTDATGQWQYRAAFDVNARDVSGQTALYVACTLGNLAVVEALLSHSVVCTRAQVEQSEEAGPSTSAPVPQAPVLSPHRAGISLGIHAIVSKLTGQAKPECSNEHRLRPVRVDLPRGNDSCIACATRGGHVRVVKRLLAAGASADASASPPEHDQMSMEWRERRRSRSAAPPSRRGATSPSPARGPYASDRDGPWTALALAARAKNVQLVELLLNHGANDPHCRALRECAKHGLTELVAALLATKAFPDPECKLNKAQLAASVFAGGNSSGGGGELTWRALCPATPVMLAWRELRCQLTHLRMSWMRAGALRVNARLGSGAMALLAVTRVDVAGNDLRLLPRELFGLLSLRLLPRELFGLLSLRYLNAAQNKLERLPTSDDPFEEDTDRRRKKKIRGPVSVYTAPALTEVHLQDNRLEQLPGDLFLLPALTTLDVSNNKLKELPFELWLAPQLRDLNAALNLLRDLPTGNENREGSPLQASTPSENSASPTPSDGSANNFFPQAKSWSRSPSIEVGEAEPDDDIPVVGDRAGNALSSETHRAHTWRGIVEPSMTSSSPPGETGGGLTALNLSHNQFSSVPASLACRAQRLLRLNMAYNSLRSMSFVTSYPTGLRQLDLSHNEITCWPSLPQVDSFGGSDCDPLTCYCPAATTGCTNNTTGCTNSTTGSSSVNRRPRSGGSVRSQLLGAACPARRHLRLEGLRTLILANNMLTRIQLTTDDDGLTPALERDDDDDDEWMGAAGLKSRLLFPLLSMLDVSCNLLKSVPPAIHELTNLAVLNLSGNKEITELPPQMGLLSRLWNLNTVGCSLNEPLRSMVAGGRYKSMDIVGYLKSVLQEAKPYARMKLMLAGVQGIGKTSLLECLRQESPIQHRRKQTDHWAKRMGNKASRRNVSTVGVDIGLWVYEKQRSTRGPVTFRTWDFGGQQEYYATHQYFLSKRSLYLVLWKVTDGRRGLAHAVGWLRSIQARAPGSPVIMVATHYDQVANSSLPESESPEALQRLIRAGIMGAADADKLGLPRVLDSLEVSCTTRHNIRLLADIIYSVAFSVKPPGSKEPLLEQRIPATYLALEECVTSLAAELPHPVLRHDEYKQMVSQYMTAKGLRTFRDAAELHQATMFLHENGVLLHYDDATLKELYFLNPQWLCDVLAHVVTVREINPFAQNGIMKLEDLAHVLKASPLLSRGDEARALGLSLLHKFELALCWDARLLLVPPLLPLQEPLQPQLPLSTRAWPSSVRNTPRRWAAPLSVAPSRATDSPTLIHEAPGSICCGARSGANPLRRLLLLSYVPVGFWARLTARVLADAALANAAGKVYQPPAEVEMDDPLSKALELDWAWKLWRSGLALVSGELTLLALRELPATHDSLLAGAVDDREPDPLYHHLRLRVRQEGSWCNLDVSAGACIEILLPAQVCVLRREDGLPLGGYQSLSLEPNPEVVAKLLATISDHVDLLLEDWYPSLGTRFVHTSEGRCLITRVVPCPSCLKDIQNNDAPAPLDLSQALRRLEMGGGEVRRPRLSQESRASDGDSGVGNESNASSRLGSVEGIVNPSPPVVHGWTVEECILLACTSKHVQCPVHPDVRLRDVAPDTLLLDVEEDRRARWEHIIRGAVAGRGAFGTVLAATWRRPGGGEVAVALKALQPVQPPPSAELAAQQAYKAAVSRWEREPSAAACRAYCALRQELGVLRPLRHAHVAPLEAVCAAPLALLLALAPQGALDASLRAYRGSFVRVGVRALRALALQLARALEYLHARRIVYRDLKSENVLVWSMPRPAEALTAERSTKPIDVHVKLGDYGISRLAPPSGTKGFGGTEGFMAPEIMRYNGEEEYNEKVDCFSYGMLLFEIVTLRQPFEGHEAVKEAVLEGARPALTPRELEYPCNVLELMRRSWSGAPSQRPSAAAAVCVCAAPEFIALQDAAAVRHASVGAAGAVRGVNEQGVGGWEVWLGGEPERAHSLLATPTSFGPAHTVRLPPEHDQPVSVTAMCRVGATMWLGDTVGRIHVYDASTLALAWGARVAEVVGGSPSRVAALQPLPSLGRVAVALACGRLFLVTASRPEASGSFVLSELGAATELCCLAAVPTSNGFEVWAGGDSLYAYAVTDAGVCGAERLDDCGEKTADRGTERAKPQEHSSEASEATESTEVTAEPRVTLLAATDEPFVLAYGHPGVCVYAWSVLSRRRTSRLDCSKLAPCSESLQSIAIEGRLSEERCRVTSLCCVGNLAYVGTAWGCVIVADAPQLRPLTVFRPYEQDVVAMIPLLPHRTACEEPMLATLGYGYRPLLQRFAPSGSGAQQQANATHGGFYCLLWRAHHWLPD